ncbi:IS21 family transposase [Halomonas campaniensis]|uniref:IS21 family transposase n=1 Tax=Halomonas campaniensis TaxID=213554 RepID=UPI00161C031B|nr:IS21 family transposase [Halomonas campaniensis]
MLSREDFLMIRQLHQRGAHLVDIAHQIGCSERTVRRHLAREEAPTGRPARPRGSKLDPYKPIIDQLLADNVWNAEVIFQLIREQGYTGGVTIVRMYIQPKRALRPSKQTVRFETQPGFQLQHDWGEIETVIAGQRCKVNFAVNTLGYSRRFHAWAAPSQDAEHTYEALVQAFRHFGGVPRTVLVDNQKAAVLKHGRDHRVIFNAGFLQLANHYGFAPKACRPQRPRTKGKTERMVGYVKQHFFQRYRQFESYAHLNQLLLLWLARVADQRPLRQFRQTPAERFSAEAKALQSLPATDFDTRYHDLRQVGWDGYIEVRGNRYSVPESYCGQAVVIRLSLDDELTVYSPAGDAIAQHRLQVPQAGWRTVPEHHAALWQQTLSVQQRDLRVYEEVL